MNKKPKATKDYKPAASCQLVEVFWAFWPAFQRWADSRTCDKNLTPQRSRILASLETKGPQIMSELRDQLGVTATNITSLVDGLEKDGLVQRKLHPTDRRATIIEITPTASKKVGQGCSDYGHRVGELFSTLKESDQKELLRIMSQLQSKLNES